MKVLIIEDNRALAKNMWEYFSLKWIKSEIAFDGIIWTQKILDNHFDVIILDINLPGKDWLTLCKETRDKWINTPILMLTSRNTTKDIVVWLNLWADDYLGKPFDFEELISRIEALNRRNFTNKNNIIAIKNIEIDISKRQVTKDSEIIKLSTKEFDLLKYLAQNKWTPFDRRNLFENVWWDFDEHMFSRSVDVYIGYLRKKLWDDLIKTQKWFGYLID
jgi:DNA-binding response OmpR family regulator